MNPSKDPTKLILLGAGPCLIGQGRESEYFAYQVLSVLREKGIDLVTVNDDPTSVLTDPDLVSHAYAEPLSMDIIEKILALEKPEGLLQVLGNQNTLNVIIFFDRDGIFDRHGIRVLGCSPESLVRTEDRELLSATLKAIPASMPEGRLITTVEESLRVARELTYPVILRPVFALKGVGGLVSYNTDETKELVSRALRLSPVGEVMVERALLGWKELEFEVLRDAAGETLALPSFENIDPLGIHTGDSLSVYPFQTVPGSFVDHLKSLSAQIAGALGLIGCVNIQYGFNEALEECAIIDVSPGLTKDASLLAQATGLRLGEVATRLALGEGLQNAVDRYGPCRLDDLDKVRDFVTLKVPSFPSELLGGSDPVLGASMKSIGSSLYIGNSFQEAFAKAFSALAAPRAGVRPKPDLREAVHHMAIPTPRRILYVQEAFRQGLEIDEVHELTRIDRSYLSQMRDWVVEESRIPQTLGQSLARESEKQIASALLRLKTHGFCDHDIATLLNRTTESISRMRREAGILPHFRSLGRNGKGEQAPHRGYLTYEGKPSSPIARGKGRPRILILGGGPAHGVTGPETDDSLAAALRALREEEHEVVLFDNAAEVLRCFDGLYDRVYLEPVHREALAHVLSIEEPTGVITQFGGESALSRSMFVEKAGFPVLGTPVSSIQTVRDLDLETRLLDRLGLAFPLTKLVTNAEEILLKSRTMRFPLVITGTTEGMGTRARILYDEGGLAEFAASGIEVSPRSPVVLRKFSENAVRLEVNALSDGTDVFVAPIIEDLEATAVSSVDSACILPSLSIDAETAERIRALTIRIAQELRIHGFLNIHYFLKDGELGVLGIHPRASHTVPFLSRALGIPLAKVGAKLLVGRKLKDFGLRHPVEPSSIAVKEAALPFDRFPGVDPVLGPGAKSTGQVMGIGETFGSAFAKSQVSIGLPLPSMGKAFISVRNQDKRSVIFIAAKLLDLGFSLIATEGTARVLSRHGLKVESVYKIAEGRPDVVDLIKNGEIHLIINTPRGKRPRKDLMEIRSQAVANRVPCMTTIARASAAVFGIQDLEKASHQPKTLRQYHRSESLA